MCVRAKRSERSERSERVECVAGRAERACVSERSGASVLNVCPSERSERVGRRALHKYTNKQRNDFLLLFICILAQN